MDYKNTVMALFATAFIGAAQAQAEDIIIHNVSIVAMDETGVVSDRAVVINEGVIQEIIAESEIGSRAGATYVDGGGAYLTPGLVDAHVHHYGAIPYINYVANGVTTVIGLGQRNQAEDFIELRARFLSGALVGPRIYTTNKTIANHIVIEDPEEARDYVREMKSDGYDLVKIYNNISKEVFDAVVDEAGKADLSVFGHLPRNFPVEYSLANGLDVVAHAEEFYFAYFGGPRDQHLADFDGSDTPDYSKIPLIVELMRENDVALIPNLTFTLVTMRFWDDEEAALSDPELQFWSEEARESWRQSNGARRNQVDKRMLRDRIKYNLMHEITRRHLAPGA